MKAKDILESKGGEIVSISENATVFQAATTLSKYKIGLLIVNNASGGFSGVLSERDVIQKCLNLKKDVEQVNVRDIMTMKENVIKGSEEEDIQTIMNTMTEKKVRHLPIFNGNELKGIISIGDVIKNLLSLKDDEIKTLAGYVSGNYPG
jgi:CBS domain-containing protein